MKVLPGLKRKKFITLKIFKLTPFIFLKKLIFVIFMIMDEFQIDNEEYDGDFDLELTFYSGQTSQPPWTNENGKFFEIIELKDNRILVELSQNKLNDPLNVKYYSNHDVNQNELRNKIFHIFDLDYEISNVYQYLQNQEELKNVYQFNKGLRLYKAQFPFECIISSICSANNSIKRWTKSIKSIREKHGEQLSIGDKSYYMFPKEEDFIEISDDELKNHGVGYRSMYMLNSTNMILEEKNYHQQIEQMNYEDAFNKINKLEGVGPKVADCILLYGYNKGESYPVDVWINRITSYLYFGNQKVSNKKIMNFAQDKFGEYSGYVQLYLFNYARLSGLMKKLKN